MPRTRALAALLALLACSLGVRSTPVGPPSPSPPSLTCGGPEPTWLVSSSWPAGGVFRCGCGQASAGSSTAWNNVTVCAALGDLLYATGSPVLGANGYTFAWLGSQAGWADAASGVATDYCSFSNLYCGASATGVPPAKGMPGLLLDSWGMVGTLPASFGALAALPDINSIGLANNAGLLVDPALLLPFTQLSYVNLAYTTLLGGTLPAAWAGLTQLTTMYLSNCQLTGTLPPEYGALSNLQALRLTTNALTGSIPAEWAGMNSMASLQLSTNSLSGTLPAAVFCSMTLENLYLDTIAFSGSIPSFSGSSPSQPCLQLTDLDLRNNALTGSIPDELAAAMMCVKNGMSQVAYLGLAGNRLTGDVPFSLTNRTCIQQLQLQRAVSVCPAGSAETTGATGTNDGSTWTRASCALCPAGYFTSTPGALLCSPCDPGYTSAQGATACTPCDAGQFLGKSGVCEACSPGSYSQRAAVGCTACQANTYSSADGTSCLSCPDGSTSSLGSPALDSCACAPGNVPVYAADNSTFTCTACGAGTFHDVVAGVCAPCPAGTYNANTGATQCTPLSTGFYAAMNATTQFPCAQGSFLNGTECAMCQPGTFTATSGALTCPPCPPSTIAPGFAAVACDACPAASSDAAEHTQCVCGDGYFDAALGASPSSPVCTACVDGGECVGGVLLAQEGWWRETPTDAVFLKCREGYCLQESASASAATTGRRLRQTQQGNCADGHSGTLCAVCLDGYTMQGGFCQPCGEGDDWKHWSRASKAITIAFFVPAGMLLLALLLLLPLLPAVERLMWGCTATLAMAAEAAGSGGMAFFRRCCCRSAEEAPVPRRSSARVAIPRRSSTGRWSQFAFGRASQTDGQANEVAEADKSAEELDTAGAGSIDELLEAASELLITLMRPGKILVKCVAACLWRAVTC